MWATLGLLGAGAASTLFVLWRKAKVERERDLLKIMLDTETKRASEMAQAVLANEKFYADQEARKEAVIAGLRKEIEALNAALEELPSGSLLGGLRAEIGIKPGPVLTTKLK